MMRVLVRNKHQGISFSLPPLPPAAGPLLHLIQLTRIDHDHGRSARHPFISRVRTSHNINTNISHSIDIVLHSNNINSTPSPSRRKNYTSNSMGTSEEHMDNKPYQHTFGHQFNSIGQLSVAEARSSRPRTDLSYRPIVPSPTRHVYLQ